MNTVCIQYTECHASYFFINYLFTSQFKSLDVEKKAESVFSSTLLFHIKQWEHLPVTNLSYQVARSISRHLNLYDLFSLRRRWIGQRIGIKLCSNRSTRSTKQVSVRRISAEQKQLVVCCDLIVALWAELVMHACCSYTCVCVFVCVSVWVLAKRFLLNWKTSKNLRARTH